MIKCTCELNKLRIQAFESSYIEFVKETLEKFKFSVLSLSTEEDIYRYNSMMYGIWGLSDKGRKK